MRLFYRTASNILKRRNLEDRLGNGNQNKALESFFSLRTAATFFAALLSTYMFFTLFQIDWASITDTLGSLDIGKYFIALISYYASFLFRGMRWKIIANNASQTEKLGAHSSKVPNKIPIGMTNLRSTTLILCGWFVNSLIWLRLGDAYRAYCLGVISKLGFPWALGTLVAERVLDMVIIFVEILYFLIIFFNSCILFSMKLLILNLFFIFDILKTKL